MEIVFDSEEAEKIISDYVKRSLNLKDHVEIVSLARYGAHVRVEIESN